MTTIRFQEIKRTVTRRLKCRNADCGKRFHRSRTFTQTINPFNKTTDGRVKGFSDIWPELGAECEAWRPDDLCGKCAAKAQGVAS